MDGERAKNKIRFSYPRSGLYDTLYLREGIPLFKLGENAMETLIADTPAKIRHFQLCALKGAVSLEAKGMKRRGQSALSIAKKNWGFKAKTAKDMLEILKYEVEKSLKNLSIPELTSL
jgi:hypothetical protein